MKKLKQLEAINLLVSIYLKETYDHCKQKLEKVIRLSLMVQFKNAININYIFYFLYLYKETCKWHRNPITQVMIGPVK